MSRTFTPCQIAERSIQKKYRRELWGPFVAAIKRYALIQENDRIAVCISGGKDSMLMAKLLQELQRHSEVPFELVYLVMDPGYNEINRQKIESNAALLHIPITVFETNIFDVANNSDKSPCAGPPTCGCWTIWPPATAGRHALPVQLQPDPSN